MPSDGSNGYDTLGLSPGDSCDPEVLPNQDLFIAPCDSFVKKGDDVFLRGSRSHDSGVEAFPARPWCPKTGTPMQEAEFGPVATLYAYTTVHVSSRWPVPYSLGYIDFPSGLRVFTQVRGPVENLRCDVKVRLAADGEAWWVEPTGGAQ